MSNSLVHRGPDDHGNVVIETENSQIGFGFRRLSIIDLSMNGHQPMEWNEEGLTVMLNGEVYNYTSLRKELELLGYSFKSNSDTEVVMKAYHKWGIKAIDRFIGMFAIAIMDKRKDELVLIRDRAGVKPFFYYHHNDCFLFASELKAFHANPDFQKELNINALALYFQHGYIPGPHSIFNHTYKLLPGHLLRYKLSNKQIETECYWSVDECYNKPIENISEQEAKEELLVILKDAFSLRLVSDVPLGVFLSGGYDSSLLCSILKKECNQQIKTYTIGFRESDFNEADYARQVAQLLQTDHTEFVCGYNEAMDVIPLLSDMYDEPFADSSAIPTYLVSKLARQQVTVALSADGGDEAFAGYTKYIKVKNYISKLKSNPKLLNTSAAYLINLFARIAPSSLHKPDRIDKLGCLLQSESEIAGFDIITQGYTLNEVKRFFSKEIELPKTAFDEAMRKNYSSELNSFLALDYKTFMVDDVLQKVDRAGMYASLEAREPMLDQRIIEFAARLPDTLKLNGLKGKYLLRL
ncbi:MAG TPA: asparagine synthase (glutamine-hydrolyzing), partial [Bacteroidia bacterium]|nr:asparagine synthase (glutamine-hydrolyzing) [Bacteroidia bacterium]